MSALTVTVTVTDAGGHTGTAAAACTIDAFVLGETKPDASNTGLNVEGIDPATLTVINGDLLIDNAWVTAHPTRVLDRVWVKGHVVFTANQPVTLQNSRVTGRSFPTAGSPPQTAMIHARSTSTPATAVLHVYNCEIRPIQPDVNIVGLSGERIGNPRRNDISRCSDAIDYWGSVFKCHGNYIHDFSFWANDPKHTNDSSHPGWSHNDGIQSNGCDGGDVFGNTIDMRADPDVGDYDVLITQFPDGAWGSAVMLTGSQEYITNAEIQKNWLGYGQAPVVMPYQSSGAFEDGGCSWEVSGNRIYALPDPYGTNQRQLIRWGWGKGPAIGSVFANTFTSDTAIPVALRGTTLPAAVLVGSATAPAGQYIVKVNA